jgi:hypothetical protein
VLSVRKHAVDLCENPDLTVGGTAALQSEVKDLENIIYSFSTTLTLDRIYERVHGYKIELGTLVKNLENERNLRDKGQTERADGVREVVTRSVGEIQTECKLILTLLTDLMSPKEEFV